MDEIMTDRNDDLSKIERMTAEQEARMIAFREQWRAIGLATGRADLDNVRPVIDKFYAKIQKAPPYLWRCASPLTANIIISLLRANLGANPKLEYTSTYRWGALDSYWIAYYLFPHTYLRPMHTAEQMVLLEGWATIARNAFWWYPFDGICFVCDRPEEYHFDERRRLHNPVGPAVRFSDGYSLYAVHGVMLPAWIIEQPDMITPSKISDERNVEIKRVMIEKYGQERYLVDSGATLLHADGYGELYSTVVQGDEPLVMVKVVNSTPEPDGSYRDYFVRVPPGMTTAEQAVAWLGGFETGHFEYVQQT